MTKNTGKVREFCQSGKVGTLFKPVCINLAALATQLLWNAGI